MRKSDKEPANNMNGSFDSKKMTRKDAIKKSGYIALTAATTMILMSTPKSASASPVSGPQSLPEW